MLKACRLAVVASLLLLSGEAIAGTTSSKGQMSSSSAHKASSTSKVSKATSSIAAKPSTKAKRSAPTPAMYGNLTEPLLALNSSTSMSTSSSSASTSTAATSVLPEAKPSKTSVPSSMVRGVNIGGWLIIEPWMNPILLAGDDVPDQRSFDAVHNASTRLHDHWSTYFTEKDVEAIADFGLNALRIPIGFWSFDNNNTNYISGAQDYLDIAIGWARTHGLKVLVDLHGHPGSQSGWEHSGDVSEVSWQSGSNATYLGDDMTRSIRILEQVSTKYGSSSYSDVVIGIEIVNEPSPDAPNDFTVTKKWASIAYNTVMAKATNPNLLVVCQDGFMGAPNWWDLASAINGNLPSSQFILDEHLYQNMAKSDDAMDVNGHIDLACSWGNAAKNSLIPVWVGEFSAATNVCVNPDGTSFGNNGTQSCVVDGCQCTDSVSIDKWSPAMVNTTRMFVEAQMQSFEHAADGYFLWSVHGYGAWSLVDMIKYGILGPTIDDRMYGHQCTYDV